MKDIYLSSDGGVDKREIFDFLRHGFDVNRLRSNRGRVDIGGRNFTIRIGRIPQRFRFLSQFDYDSAVRNVELVFGSLSDREIIGGAYLRNLRGR